MRIKFSVPRHARKKKVLKQASGYYGDKSRRLRMAAVREEGLSYSKFISGLAQANITLNRKMLSEMAIKDPVSFKKLVDVVKAAK